MNPSLSHGPDSHASGRDSAAVPLPGPELDSLRLIATLPAPEGLADRIKAGLRAAPDSGRILLWQGPLRPAAGWMFSPLARGAAAAAIVCIVAGGGWRIYSHVRPAPDANVIGMPSPAAPPVPFTTSGARHVPDTLQGPVLKHPLAPAPPANMPEINVVDKLPATPHAAPPRKTRKTPSKAAPAPLQ
jgi:hypothetical protein